MSQFANATLAGNMANILRAKFACFASQLPGMTRRSHNGIQYVDSGWQSDTFNTVYGAPAFERDIAVITAYYRQQNKPAAWWFDISPGALTKALVHAGWVYEEQNVGMVLTLPAALPTPCAVLSHSKTCDNQASYDDFGRVLSAIFEAGNPAEAKNIRAIYALAGVHCHRLSSNMVHLVGYLGSEAVATATLYINADTAGIFDIATPVAWRNRGFASQLFSQALQIAQQRGATTCVLQASPAGINLYKRYGFRSAGCFEVWNRPQQGGA